MPQNFVGESVHDDDWFKGEVAKDFKVKSEKARVLIEEAEEELKSCHCEEEAESEISNLKEDITKKG